jgi:serine/threonine-protein kinase RsbT
MNSTVLVEGCFHLMGGDFKSAGVASSEFKKAISKLGIPNEIIRKAAIAAFEAEMNVIIHAIAGTMHYVVTQEEIKIIFIDMGPGIKDIDLAMQEGYSTAPDWVKEMGWGAGMGLPNIKKNSDILNIDSVVGEGTTLEIVIKLGRDQC